MTLSNELNRIDATSVGGATYPYTFKIFADSDLTVIVTDTAGVATTKVLTADYSVTGAGLDVGGTVVFVVAPTTGYRVSIIASVPLTQTTDLVNETGFFQDRIETALDRTVRMAQVAKEIADRGLRLPEGEADDPGSGLLTVLPSFADRAGRTLAFDATTGQPMTIATATSAISSPMQLVVQSADLYLARAAMAVGTQMEPVLNATTLALARAAMGIHDLINNTLSTLVSVFVGSRTPSGDDSAILIGRNFPSGANSHGFRDESNVVSVAGYTGYSAYDEAVTFSGPTTDAASHCNGIQLRPTLTISGTLFQINGLYDAPTHNGAGTLTNRYGIHIYDVGGAGVVNNQYGIYVEWLVRASNQFAIYTAGTTPSYFGGNVEVGGSLPVGLGAGNRTVSINGGASASADGSALLFYCAGLVKSAIGNLSAILGTAYDATSLWYSGAGISAKVYSGGALAVTFNDSQQTVLAGAVILGQGTLDPAGSNGMMYYDTTNNRIRAYVNGAWKTVTVA